MDAIINPTQIGGEISSISSKSHAHRVLICSAFSDSPTEIIMDEIISKDIEVTMGCLTALGCGIKKLKSGGIIVSPIKHYNKDPILDCDESGSTLRFLLPIVSAIGANATFTGCGRLPQRPISQLLTQLSAHGITFSSSSLPLTISGKMQNGIFELSGSQSSQYISGMLLALPLLCGIGEIKLMSHLQSKSYVDMTVSVMRDFGADVQELSGGYRVTAPQGYKSPGTVQIEGDWSNSAFWLCLGAISKSVVCKNLNIGSSQGDKAIVEILKKYGANVDVSGHDIKVSPNKRKAFYADAADIPDLVPILSVIASAADGVSKISNTQRLKLKESDRIESTLNMLRSMGGKAEYEDGTLIIHGQKELSCGTVDGAQDHRIVMSAAIASCLCHGKLKITDALAVCKSYPHFFDNFKDLGGLVNVF
ncbi:MAG: 3-phosphoshikimate 1-carboxyvinyltransferase [Oscillospiraceae bacterium]|jgi:3-phosphoshikimate 1-carboxyvinyltransferase|nr:3-phosphoshikimate 1-carboxyvinyltransferase [Oscillospiraceae bacterium]